VKWTPPIGISGRHVGRGRDSLADGRGDNGLISVQL